MSFPARTPLQLAEDAYVEGTMEEFMQALVSLPRQDVGRLGDFIIGYQRRVKQEVRS